MRNKAQSSGLDTPKRFTEIILTILNHYKLVGVIIHNIWEWSGKAFAF